MQNQDLIKIGIVVVLIAIAVFTTRSCNRTQVNNLEKQVDELTHLVSSKDTLFEKQAKLLSDCQSSIKVVIRDQESVLDSMQSTLPNRPTIVYRNRIRYRAVDDQNELQELINDIIENPEKY